MKEVIREVIIPELTELWYSAHQQFVCLCNLCEFVEKSIRVEAKRRRTDAHRKRQDSESVEAWAFKSVAVDDNLFEIKRDFPRMLRYSMLISLMCATESFLVRLCRVAHSRLGLKAEFSEKGNDVIQRALKYLHDEAGLDTSRMRYDKELADDLRKLRNAVAHSDGCIKGRKDAGDIRAFAKPRTGVKIDRWNNIVLSGRFVMNNAHGMRELIVELHGKLKKKIGVHITRSRVITKSGQ